MNKRESVWCLGNHGDLSFCENKSRSPRGQIRAEYGCEIITWVGVCQKILPRIDEDHQGRQGLTWPVIY